MKNQKVIDSICEQCVKKWGINKQTDQAIQEMAELIKAILKLRQMEGYSDVDKYNRFMEMLEEVVDVEFMIRQLKYMLLNSLKMDFEYEQIWNNKIKKIQAMIDA